MSFDLARAVSEARALPPRQRAMLRGLADGKLRKEIAAENNIAVGTVNRHVEIVFTKLGIHSKSEAARVAVAARIV